jgi:hypothetical protein
MRDTSNGKMPVRRGGRPLQNRFALVAIGFVAAARFLGGQLFTPFLNRTDPLSRLTTP